MIELIVLTVLTMITVAFTLVALESRHHGLVAITILATIVSAVAFGAELQCYMTREALIRHSALWWVVNAKTGKCTLATKPGLGPLMKDIASTPRRQNE